MRKTPAAAKKQAMQKTYATAMESGPLRYSDEGQNSTLLLVFTEASRITWDNVPMRAAATENH
ncbi:MAG: hypothetical protein ACXV45_07390, partial [Halobacteriota archaeon]